MQNRPLPSLPQLPPRRLIGDLRRLWRPDSGLRRRLLNEHRRLIVLCLMSVGPLGAAYWVLDWLLDPVGAQNTLGLRLLYLLLVPTGLLLNRVRRSSVFGALLLFTLAWTVALYSLVLARLAGGVQVGIGAYLLFYFFALICLSGLSLRWALVFAVCMPAIPHGLALAGLMPGFDHLSFALLLWPMSNCVLLLHVLMAQNFLRRHDLECLLQEASNTDPLTGVGNRRQFLQQAGNEMARAAPGQPLSLLMLDIDHFKRINDNHGHASGDRAIQQMATICVDGSRRIDAVARLGGEEFAVLLPATAEAQARVVAERIRALAEQAQTPDDKGQALRFTVSIGLACLQPGMATTEQLLARADAALYEAKRGGRNRVMAAPAA